MSQQCQPAPAFPDATASSQPRLAELIVSIATQSWLASMALHMTLFIVLALVLGTIHVAATIGAAPILHASNQTESLESEIEHFIVGEAPLEPTVLNAETLMLSEPPGGLEAALAESASFEPAGGTVNPGQAQAIGTALASDFGLGPALRDGPGNLGLGLGIQAGQGGAEAGYNVRIGDARSKLKGLGATIHSERAVAAALNWFGRHQNPDGSWSLDHTPRCRSGACSGAGQQRADAAATALGLLPFLAAGQTQDAGPYRKNIAAAIDWLIKHQQKSGDLSSGGSQMYSHGLATIALCEAYGMTHDSRVGYAAQAALDFIVSGQNKDGSWRYTHGTDSSDTSVFGWQVMALKSGQMAGLKVQPATLDGCRRYLRKVAQGQYQSEFSYAPGGGPTFTMTSVGLLTSQYLGARRDDAVIVGGLDYLSRRKPAIQQRNSYYWYYATQVMHNVPGPQWDDWNRAMRRLLIETQEPAGCQSGSWDPSRPEPDPWGNQGGRLMVTSLSCLTLEVYYRYLPLYKIDEGE